MKWLRNDRVLQFLLLLTGVLAIIGTLWSNAGEPGA